MSVKLNLLRKLVRELIKKELEEASMTGNIDGGAGPPKTPKALKKNKKNQDESGFQDGHEDPTVSTTYRKVKEAIQLPQGMKLGKVFTGHGKSFVKEESINESDQSWAKYYSWRNDKSMTPKQKIGMSMREVRDSLQGLERIINRNIKLKKELKVGSNNYWKSTHSALRRIHERLVKLTGKIASLY